MSIDYNRLREIVEKHSPAPWAAIDKNDDGKPRPATSRLMRDTDGEYLGIMHHPDAELAALAPDMARELLALRDGVKQVADELGEKADYAPNIPRQAAYTEAEQRLNHLLEGDTA